MTIASNASINEAVMFALFNFTKNEKNRIEAVRDETNRLKSTSKVKQRKFTSNFAFDESIINIKKIEIDNRLQKSFAFDQSIINIEIIEIDDHERKHISKINQFRDIKFKLRENLIYYIFDKNKNRFCILKFLKFSHDARF